MAYPSVVADQAHLFSLRWLAYTFRFLRHPVYIVYLSEPVQRTTETSNSRSTQLLVLFICLCT